MAEAGNARKWAHTVMAEMLAEQARSVRENEADLVQFRKQHGRLSRAAARRDATIAAAHTHYERVAREAETAAGAALARLHQRGMSESQLCAVTGLGAGRIRRLLRGGTARTGPDTDPGTGAAELPVVIGVVDVDESAAGDHPPQPAQSEDAQRDG